MESKAKRWVLGLSYIFAVALIWIFASFVVQWLQTVGDRVVTPFLITYICNSLFVIHIPLVEIGRYLEDTCGGLLFWRYKETRHSRESGDLEMVDLLRDRDLGVETDGLNMDKIVEENDITQDEVELHKETDGQVDEKGRWTRARVAKVSMLICPFWFFAQFYFNLSLKYTTVTSNTIISSTSSLFTFLVSLAFLGEKFTWLKLVSVLLCMAGTIIVSLGDSESGGATNPLLGDIFSLISAACYAVYVTLIRKKLPDEDDKRGRASMAQFLGYLGLFNLMFFLPVGLILHFAKLEPFSKPTWKQFGLIAGKGLLDNVLSDYLWAKAVLLTTTTVATAGLSIQVPMAAIVDSVTGKAPRLMDYLGAIAVLVGFAGINIPSDACGRSEEVDSEIDTQNISSDNQAPAASQTVTVVS